MTESRSREVDGDLQCSVEYDTSTATLLLCDEHLHRIQATVVKNDESAKANRTPIPLTNGYLSIVRTTTGSSHHHSSIEMYRSVWSALLNRVTAAG